MRESFVICVGQFDHSCVLAANGTLLEAEFRECSPYLEDWNAFPFDTVPLGRGLYVWEGSVWTSKDETGENVTFNGEFRRATSADLLGFGLLG